MPRNIARRLQNAKGGRNALIIYSTVLLLIFHSYLVMYVNSSYIEQYVGENAVGSIFTIGSALTILIFLFISRVLHRVGNYRATLALLILNLVAVAGMGFADSLRTSIPLFILHLTVLPLIIFNLDVFLEENIGNRESTTGSKRGLLLALTSLVGALTPLLTGVLIGNTQDFSIAYTASALALLPVIFIVLFSFKTFKDPKYKEIQLFTAIRSFWIKPNIRDVFLAHFLLQMFFFFMVVYTPLYLSTQIGLDWTSIGIIFFGAQLAYVFFEFPIGRIGDLYIGEKEMMILGFFIIAITTATLAFIDTQKIWVWVIIMFATRVGASLAEVTTESYFFKHTKSSDAQIISFFRITRPLSYVVGALIGSLAILYIAFNYIFIVAAILVLPGVFFAHRIVDTK